MFRLTLILLTGALNLTARAQELIKNGNFELKANCPSTLSELFEAEGWSSASNATPDYFNECASVYIGVPTNVFGHQYARSGVGYGGIYIWVYPYAGKGYREYMETELKEALKEGVCYHFEMYINVPASYKYTSDQIGVYFSDSFHYEYTMENLKVTPQITNKTGNFPDTTNWTQVSTDYVAKGGERFLIIGAFNDELNVDTVDINPSIDHKSTYFYIDDVSLTECLQPPPPPPPAPPIDTSFNKPRPPKPSGNCISIPNAFSPDNDGRNDRFGPIFECGVSRYTLKIFNRYGARNLFFG
ncbi:MAG: gliding motility-associated C-terminal domain-containing protein [Chitinophagaceae bacterium]|nr:gliding motility-associated C-terminal domain-containing protein [Chitinophagaceae bacterium]